MNKIIALDIGGVCMQLDPSELLQAMGMSSINEVTEELWGLSDLFEKGQLSEPEWLKLIAGIAPEGTSDDDVYNAWNSLLKDTMPGMTELTQELCDAGYQIIFFSDTSPVHMREVYRKLDFANLASGSILSYEVGSKKPAAGMYEAFEAKYGVPCFYIDDRINNIKAAQDREWPAHLFTDADGLRQALVEAKML